MSAGLNWASNPRAGLRGSSAQGQNSAPLVCPTPAPSRLNAALRAHHSASRLQIRAHSARALDADVSNGAEPRENSPVGKLGFSTALEEDFHTTGSRHLGSGAYGVVNLVVNRRTGVEYACKVLPKVRGRLTPAKTAKKIWAEVNIMSRVQRCGNVAALHSVYENDDSVFIVQELCHGGDLEQLLEAEGPFTERQAALVLYECLTVVAACHAEGVVHGDVKPANFLLKQRQRNPLALLEAGSIGSGWVKAIDFGCSQEDRGLHLSRRTGTPVYMAPEVFLRDYGRAADMWSLGMMLYQFLSCRFPFWTSLADCREKSLDQVARAVAVDDIRTDYGPFAAMSTEGVDLLRWLLDRDPVQRCTCAEALDHPWFEKMRARHGGASRSSNNVVPLEGTVRRRVRGVQRTPPASPPTPRPAFQHRQAAPPAEPQLQQSVLRVGRSYPSPAAVAQLAY